MKRNTSKSANKVLKGAAVSLLVCMITTLIGISISAYMIHKELIDQNSGEIVTMVVLTVSSAAGALTAMQKIKGLMIPITLLSVMTYILMLFSVTALFFEGQYNGVGRVVSAILLGGVIALAVRKITGSSKNKYKAKKLYR